MKARQYVTAETLTTESKSTGLLATRKDVTPETLTGKQKYGTAGHKVLP